MADARHVGGETDIIQRFLAPLAAGVCGAFQLKDDCAVFTPPQGHDIVLNTDAVVAGVHLFADDDPAAFAWKALAANVSDIVAKGATPEVYLMNLTLPELPSEAWLQAFASGLRAAQEKFGCQLTGGDTDRVPESPFSVAITMIGHIPSGHVVQRGTAQPGDVVFVSGPIGDAALGLRLVKETDLAAHVGLTDAMRKTFVAAYRQPTPSLQVASVIRDVASAAMDISDGLVKDFTRLVEASGCGGELNLSEMPVSKAARMMLNSGACTHVDLATGGEDYVVLGTVSPANLERLQKNAARQNLTLTPIGHMREASSGLVVRDASGNEINPGSGGWDHFDNSKAALTR